MMEEYSEIIGAPCTLLEDYKGYTDGVVVADFRTEIVVQFSSGAEIVTYRDEVLVYD
jgi:hypothetical protein